MDINTFVQNEYGVSALMAASKDPDLLFVVKHLLNRDSDNINLCDTNGETALFYAVHNIDAFRLLLDFKINTNSLNKDKDSILTYCCRNKIYEPLRSLSVKEFVDVNIFNNDERTALMYLMDDARCTEIKYFIDNKNVNLYFKNHKNETAFSIFFKNYYEAYRKLDMDKILSYIKVIKLLLQKKISLNVSIDEEGNTPMMFFLMIEDWVTMAYIVLNCLDIDLSIKNNKGESFSSLCAKHKPSKESTYSGINAKYLMYHIFSQPSFDASYRGIAGMNVLMDYIIYYTENYDFNFKDMLKAHKEYLTVTNDDQENLLIVATKLGCHDIITHIVFESSDVNQQDILGNTALHYAVTINDYYIANLLAYYHADINIKNKEGKSPVNLINDSGDSAMLKTILKPCPSYKFEKKEKKSSSIFSFKKTYEYREVNEKLREKYQEKYNDIVRENEEIKVDYKYIPNKTPKYNTEYYTDVFKAYFPQVVEAFEKNRTIVAGINNVVDLPDIVDSFNDYVKLQPNLYHMLTNKSNLNCRDYFLD